MTIKIKGDIGIDVLGTQFSEFMSRLDGDVNVEIDSPGGFLTDGIAIANALRDYNKGKVNVRVVGQASSMAAYVMLFGDTLSFTPNAIVCLHNPWNVCIGDYVAMEKNADLLKRFAGLYAKRFVEKGIFKEDEIRSIMDKETFFIGADELARLGTVENSDTDKPDEQVTEEDKETAVILAQERIKACKNKIQASYNEDLEKVAALLQQAPATTRAQTTSAQKPASDSNTVQSKGEKEMNANEIKSQHPDVYADIVKAGAEQEQKRVNALMKFIDVDKETVVKAIAEGKSIHDDEVYAALTMAKINQNTVAQMEKENPDDVNPKEPDHSKEGEGQEGGEKPETPEEKARKEQEAKEAEAKQLNNVLGRLGIDPIK